MTPGTEAGQSEWRQHWPVVLAAAAGGTMATVHLYSLGVLIAPIEREFGWSRALITSGLTIVAVVGAVLAPLIGATIDRVGARRVGVGGAFLFCTFVGLLSLAANTWSWWALWAGIAVAAACIAPTVWAAGVSPLFERSRGMALAFTLTGTSIGAIVVPTLTHHLLDLFGWRLTYAALAGIWAFLALPLIFACFRETGEAADRRMRSRERSGGAAGWKAVASSKFVRLAIAAMAIVTVASSLIPNLVPILVSGGLSSGRAAAFAGLVGVGSLTGRLIGGFLLDRINGSIVAGVCVLMPIATSLLLLTMPGSATAAAAAILIMGVAVGVEWDAAAYLASRHFGTANFGTVFGTIGGGVLLMNGIGPFLTSYAYDATGTYSAALWTFIPLCLLSSLLFFTLGPYPAVEADREEVG